MAAEISQKTIKKHKILVSLKTFIPNKVSASFRVLWDATSAPPVLYHARQ